MTFRVGLNPLPWVLTASGFELSVPVLRDAFGEISQTPFVGIHADPPADLDADGYRKLLTEFGLVPAPGYFSADFADVSTETSRGGSQATRRRSSDTSATPRSSSRTESLRLAATHLRSVPMPTTGGCRP